MSPTRISTLVVLSTFFFIGAACLPGAEDRSRSSTATSLAPPPSPTTSVPPMTTIPRTTTTMPKAGYRFEKVDPRTLAPVAGLEPIFTGETQGFASPNGRWLVLESWGEGRWLIDTVSWEVAADFRPWGWLLEVRDDGMVFAVDWDPVLEIRRYTPVAENWEVVARLEVSWPFSGKGPAFIDDHRLAGRGHTDENWADGELTVNVLDIASGMLKEITVPGAWVPGEPTGIFLEETYEISTFYEPAVAFTEERAFVVHAHEDVVSEVTLETGEVVAHDLRLETSLLESLLAWIAPPANAKGPAPGVRRNVTVDEDGSRLFISGYLNEISLDDKASDEDERIIETTRPLGVQVVNTETWHVEKTLDLPIGTVHLSPDGSVLMGTGYIEDGFATGGHWYRGSGVYAITTDTYQVTHFDSDYEFETWIEFSADGSYAYLLRDYSIDVIDLERLEIVAEWRGSNSLQMWGSAGVTSEWLGGD